MYVVQLLEFLPSMHTTLGSFLSIRRLNIVVHTCNSSAGEVDDVGTSGVKGHSWRQSKFEARLGYIKLCLEMKVRRKKRKEGRGGIPECRQFAVMGTYLMPPEWKKFKNRAWSSTGISLCYGRAEDAL